MQLSPRKAAPQRRIERRQAGGNRPGAAGEEGGRAPDLAIAEQLLEGTRVFRQPSRGQGHSPIDLTKHQFRCKPACGGRG